MIDKICINLWSPFSFRKLWLVSYSLDQGGLLVAWAKDRKWHCNSFKMSLIFPDLHCSCHFGISSWLLVTIVTKTVTSVLWGSLSLSLSPIDFEEIGSGCELKSSQLAVCRQFTFDNNLVALKVSTSPIKPPSKLQPWPTLGLCSLWDHETRVPPGLRLQLAEIHFSLC